MRGNNLDTVIKTILFKFSLSYLTSDSSKLHNKPYKEFTSILDVLYKFWMWFRFRPWLHKTVLVSFVTSIGTFFEWVEEARHSMARANLNKSEKFLTNTTAASKYILTYLGGPDSASIEILPLRSNLISKITSKCEHCQTRFTS